MKNKFGKCKGCGEERLIRNRTYFLCDGCNFKRLYGKSKYEVQIEKLKGRKTITKGKIKRHRIRVKKKKPTGEADLFKEIWEEREHICHNCKISLGSDPKTFFFMHIKAKGAYPSLRLEKSNIALSCFDCHYAYDMVSKESYKNRKDLYSNK